MPAAPSFSLECQGITLRQFGLDVAELKVLPVSSIHAEAAVLVTRAAD
jgi:hypothetical protein